MNDKNIIQMPDGYLNKTPLFQFGISAECLLWRLFFNCDSSIIGD